MKIQGLREFDSRPILLTRGEVPAYKQRILHNVCLEKDLAAATLSMEMGHSHRLDPKEIKQQFTYAREVRLASVPSL